MICISTYPRKGTETTNPAHIKLIILISTYPRKGTEKRGRRRPWNSGQISTYPRKGTETRAPCQYDRILQYFNLSP